MRMWDGFVSAGSTASTSAPTKLPSLAEATCMPANSHLPGSMTTTVDGGRDPFSALDAIRYISYLAIGYMIARGLAKMGSRETYDDHRRG